MAGISYYMRPDEVWSYQGSVADTVGTTATDYTNEWLCDGRSGRPARATGGSITWTITNPAGQVDCVVVANHLVDANRSITIGGTISASLTAPARLANGCARNPFASIAGSASVTTLTVSVMANSSPVIIGEVFAGHLRALPRFGFLVDGLDDRYESRGGTYVPGFVPAYDTGVMAPRIWRGTVRCNASQAADMEAWQLAQRNGSRPGVVIPDIAVQDARVVHLDDLTFSRDGLLWRAALTLVEYPSVRW